MSILHTILDLTVIAVICASVAWLVIGLGKWKVKVGLLPGFKDQAGKKPYRAPLRVLTDYPS
jgi:hypothetical protein